MNYDARNHELKKKFVSVLHSYGKRVKTLATSDGITICQQLTHILLYIFIRN